MICKTWECCQSIIMNKYIILTISCLLFLASCAVYKIDVQQGNVVTQEMLNQLQYNMPTRKVRFIMGSPLIVDVFHQNRWDYLYSFQAGGDQRMQRTISLFFENDKLIRVSGDVTLGKQPEITQPPTSPSEIYDEEPIL